jgi:BlaR1 peptidase M56/TonB-dependent Receptor Plug Domain
MNSQIILLYVVKTIIVAGIFWVYYHFALRNKRFHYYNRFYLLSAMAASLIVPFFQFDWFTIENPNLNEAIVQMPIQYLTYTSSTEPGFSWMDGLVFIFVSITIGILVLVLNQIRTIYSVKRKSQHKFLDEYHFIQTDEENAPFSFLNNLFWKKTIALDTEYGQKIFTHEITHIKQRHTWDRLFCQLVTAMVWINPFYWLIQKELQTIHEFIADEAAIGEAGVAEFAKMLLQTHYDTQFFNPIHTFFYSSIKRRLFMLTTSSQTKFSYARRIMVLPLLIVAIGIFSFKVHAKERISEKVTELSDLILHNVSKISIVDTVPVEKGKSVKVQINKIDTVTKDNQKTITIKKTISTTTLDTTVNGSLGNLDINQIVKDALKSVDINKVVNDALKNVDINKLVKEEMKHIEINNDGDENHKNVTVKIRNSNQNIDTSMNIIIQKGGNMVVIQTKDKAIAAKALEDGAKSITTDVTNGEKVYTIVRETSNQKIDDKTLIFVDGKAISQKEMAAINPSNIQSVNVLKGESAIKKYGEKAANGVIEITLKKAEGQKL